MDIYHPPGFYKLEYQSKVPVKCHHRRFLFPGLGVYLHGLAGDIAVEESSYESIIATDIINSVSKAFNRLKEDQG